MAVNQKEGMHRILRHHVHRFSTCCLNHDLRVYDDKCGGLAEEMKSLLCRPEPEQPATGTKGALCLQLSSHRGAVDADTRQRVVHHQHGRVVEGRLALRIRAATTFDHVLRRKGLTPGLGSKAKIFRVCLARPLPLRRAFSAPKQ